MARKWVVEWVTKPLRPSVFPDNYFPRKYADKAVADYYVWAVKREGGVARARRETKEEAKQRSQGKG